MGRAWRIDSQGALYHNLPEKIQRYTKEENMLWEDFRHLITVQDMTPFSRLKEGEEHV
jgi:hypothetical protein